MEGRSWWKNKKTKTAKDVGRPQSTGKSIPWEKLKLRWKSYKKKGIPGRDEDAIEKEHEEQDGKRIRKKVVKESKRKLTGGYAYATANIIYVSKHFQTDWLCLVKRIFVYAEDKYSFQRYTYLVTPIEH